MLAGIQVRLRKKASSARAATPSDTRSRQLWGYGPKLRRIIAQQKKRIGRITFIGINTDRAILILSTLNDLMATYQRHRQWITAYLADDDEA